MQLKFNDTSTSWKKKDYRLLSRDANGVSWSRQASIEYDRAGIPIVSNNELNIQIAFSASTTWNDDEFVDWSTKNKLLIFHLFAINKKGRASPKLLPGSATLIRCSQLSHADNDATTCHVNTSRLREESSATKSTNDVWDDAGFGERIHSGTTGHFLEWH